MRNIVLLLGLTHMVIVLTTAVLAGIIIRARTRRDDGHLSALLLSWILMGLIMFGFWILVRGRLEQIHYLVIIAELFLYLYIGSIAWGGWLRWRQLNRPHGQSKHW